MVKVFLRVISHIYAKKKILEVQELDLNYGLCQQKTNSVAVFKYLLKIYCACITLY